MALSGCGGAAAPPLPEGVARVGDGPEYQPTAALRTGAPVGAHACAKRIRRSTAHVELFAHGRVVIIPAGIGVAPPRQRDGAYVRGGRCRYPLWTEEPTGLIDMAARDALTIGDLFAIWGRPLTDDRLASFTGRVRAFVAGKPWPGDPNAIPLRHHAQIVIEIGEPVIPPHAAYRFPPGR